MRSGIELHVDRTAGSAEEVMLKLKAVRSGLWSEGTMEGLQEVLRVSFADRRQRDAGVECRHVLCRYTKSATMSISSSYLRKVIPQTVVSTHTHDKVRLRYSPTAY